MAHGFTFLKYLGLKRNFKRLFFQFGCSKVQLSTQNLMNGSVKIIIAIDLGAHFIKTIKIILSANRRFSSLFAIAIVFVGAAVVV